MAFLEDLAHLLIWRSCFPNRNVDLFIRISKANPCRQTLTIRLFLMWIVLVVGF